MQSNHSAKIHTYLLEALQLHLTHENIPYHLRNTELIFIDTSRFSLSDQQNHIVDNSLKALHDRLDHTEKHLVLIFPNTNLLQGHVPNSPNFYLFSQLKLLLSHHKCRFLLLSDDHHLNNQLNLDFTSLHFSGPTESDIAILLKQERAELENYHHVLIPDEMLEYAHSLSERYLGTNNIIENTLLLLDSSAARASTDDRSDLSNQSKPVLTLSVMTNVLSGWTKIPATHLQLTKFKLIEIIQGMQQRIFGQDAAIAVLSHQLQQIHSHTQKNPGPFCSLLFAGPEHSGKRSTTLALVEHLFKQLGLLYIIPAASLSAHTLTETKLQRCTDKLFFSLADVLNQTPYAVIMIENIEQASSSIIDELHEILATGLLNDSTGKQHHFHQSILILTTTLGSKRIADLNTFSTAEEDDHNSDLMHLIMHDQKHTPFTDDIQYSPQELTDMMLPDISAYLSTSLCQYLHVVPFLPLNKDAIEKIFRLKLKILGKQLDTRYSIELGYAPEVIRYLINEVQLKQESDNQLIDTDNVLKHLYFCVEQTVFSHAENKNRPAQLFLQLNETGQSLRCDWLSMSAMRQQVM